MYCVHGRSGTSILLFEFFDDELERERERERERETFKSLIGQVIEFFLSVIETKRTFAVPIGESESDREKERVRLGERNGIQ